MQRRFCLEDQLVPQCFDRCSTTPSPSDSTAVARCYVTLYHLSASQALKQVFNPCQALIVITQDFLLTVYAAHALPAPSRLRRVLFVTSISLTSLSLGVYLASHPQITNLTALLRPPSTSSSLAYLPPTERATEINNLITNHPLYQRLRSDPEWTESRPHLRMPPLMRQHSLTASTLMGDTKIPVPPLMFTKGDKGEELIAISYLGADLCGHVGIIHGGMLATMLDEGLARCCFAALPSKVGVTARLEIDFRKPTKSDGFVVLKARTVKVEGRKAWVKGRVEVLPMPVGGDGNIEGRGNAGPYEEKGEVLVEAEGLFVEPRWAKVRGIHPGA